MTYQDYYGSQAFRPNPNFGLVATPEANNRAAWGAMPISAGMQYLDTQRKVREATRKMSEQAMLQKANADLALLLAAGHPGSAPAGNEGFRPMPGPRLNLNAAPTNTAEASLQALINDYRRGQDVGFSRGFTSERANVDRERQQAKENLAYQKSLFDLKRGIATAPSADEAAKLALEAQQLKNAQLEQMLENDEFNRKQALKEQIARDKVEGKKSGKLPTYHDLAQGIQAGVIPDEATLKAYPNAQLSSDQWTSLLGQLGRKQQEFLTLDTGNINPLLKQLNDDYATQRSMAMEAIQKRGESTWNPLTGFGAYGRAEDTAKARATGIKTLNDWVNTKLNGPERLRDVVEFDPQTNAFKRRILPTDKVDAIPYATPTPYAPAQPVPPPVRQITGPQYGPWPTAQMFQPSAPVQPQGNVLFGPAPVQPGAYQPTGKMFGVSAEPLPPSERFGGQPDVMPVPFTNNLTLPYRDGYPIVSNDAEKAQMRKNQIFWSIDPRDGVLKKTRKK